MNYINRSMTGIGSEKIPANSNNGYERMSIARDEAGKKEISEKLKERMGKVREKKADEEIQPEDRQNYKKMVHVISSLCERMASV